MRFTVIFYISLMANLVCFSQKDSIIIKGSVITELEHKKIENAYVHLISSQGPRYEYKTDSTGKYKFKFYTDAVFSCTISVASDKYTTNRRVHNLGFLATKDVAIFELKPGNIYEKNFELTEVPFCGPIAPSILFYKNSILSCNDSLHQKDSAFYGNFKNIINTLYLSLLEEPTITIEIHGHADYEEKNTDYLSLYRAQFIKELLVTKGINKKRIDVKGRGHEKLIIRKKIIKQAKTSQDKLALHLKNQRVVFRIINWDFKE